MLLKNCVDYKSLNKIKMKKIQSFICFLFITAFASAQDSSVILKNYKDFKMPLIQFFKKPNYLNGDLNIKDFTLINSSNKNETVIILPLDNMPCFIPDISKVSKMPNQQSKGSAVNIPNKIIVESK